MVGMGTPTGATALTTRGEGEVAAQGGAGWRAASAMIFPLIMEGFDSVFVAAAALAQFELWLPMGVARKPSAI